MLYHLYQITETPEMQAIKIIIKKSFFLFFSFLLLEKSSLETENKFRVENVRQEKNQKWNRETVKNEGISFGYFLRNWELISSKTGDINLKIIIIQFFKWLSIISIKNSWCISVASHLKNTTSNKKRVKVKVQ